MSIPIFQCKDCGNISLFNIGPCHDCFMKIFTQYKSEENKKRNAELDKLAQEAETPTEADKAEEYDKFIRSGLAAGFTDDQVNWLEKWIYDKLK